ncbi:hypothetical protein PGT21_035558 [Puccinia graminis f. sp. tritici]|uniref:Tyrosinase copper-binding domain-containing protein n=1 Tax=Puccinia graminis f. sp. tritici TaxID=56615 RepID=A0A5B0PKD0_PUCGR|nr:hypothetical protein PGT21_035558 [Puccinia graminis f. sp. tritici]
MLLADLVPGQSVGGRTCPKITTRKEWRQLSRETQASYIKAVKCLTTKPATLRTRFRLRRYDDFQYVHSTLYMQVHFVARFLPWHRHIVFLYEQALRECGYQEGVPHWDWSLDAADASRSPVFSSDPQVGFGGNGTGRVDPRLPDDGGAVQTGAFSNFQLIHPIPHLLHRKFDAMLELSSNNVPYLGEFYSKSKIAEIQKTSDFLNYSNNIEGQNPMIFPDAPSAPHAAIHIFIGGEMPHSVYAANEPLFFLHHAHIDKLWADWQRQDWKNRKRAYHGNNVRGDQTEDASIDDKMPFLGLGGQDPTVLSVMDTTAYPYCYTYAN